MNLFEAGYALGLALMEGESQQSFHAFGPSPETRHKRQRHGWNLYGGKFDDANEVNAYDRHMDERKKAARHAGKFGAVVGGIAGAGLAHRYGTPYVRGVTRDLMRGDAEYVRGLGLSAEKASKRFRSLPSNRAAAFTRKHAGKLTAGAGLGLGALALGGAAYMKTRWSKDKRAHKYDEKSRSYKPVA